MEGKLYTTREISDLFGISIKAVCNMCHARGQRFAIRLKKGGNWKINKTRFEKHLEGRLNA